MTHPALIVQPINDLIPYSRNARTHSVAQIGKIAASIRAFGFTNPVQTDGAGGSLPDMEGFWRRKSWE